MANERERRRNQKMFLIKNETETVKYQYILTSHLSQWMVYNLFVHLLVLFGDIENGVNYWCEINTTSIWIDHRQTDILTSTLINSPKNGVLPGRPYTLSLS